MQWTLWAEQAVNGLTIGATYALIALGYTMVYGVLQMINFAHGEVYMLGAFAGYLALTALMAAGLTGPLLPVAVFLAFLAGVAGAALSGALIERIAYRPLRRAPRLAPLVSAIGVSIFLQNAVLLLTNGRPQSYPRVFPDAALELGDLRVAWVKLFILGLSLALMLALYLFVQRTQTGRAMRAVAEDRDTAALMGIDVDRTITTTFMLGAAAAGAAGVLIGLYYSQIDFYMGFMPGIKAFAAAVVGGIGNIPGAMLGGLFLGLAETLSVQFVPSFYKDVIALALLVVVLTVRPTGLLGEVIGRRA